MIFIIVFFSVVSKNLGEGGGEGFRGRETSLQGPRKAFILFKKGNPQCTAMAFNRKITDLEYYIGHQESVIFPERKFQNVLKYARFMTGKRPEAPSLEWMLLDVFLLFCFSEDFLDVFQPMDIPLYGFLFR